VEDVEAYDKLVERLDIHELVYRRLLTKLWPQEPITTEELTEANHKQSETTRRLRELRQLFGFRIVYRYKSGGNPAGYRLLSRDSEYKQRIKNLYFSDGVKNRLKKAASPVCTLCRKEFPEHSGYLQYDHRKPAVRGGEAEFENVMFLCPTCNVGKKQRCADCKKDDCDGCVYAHPERFGTKLTITLDDESWKKIHAAARAREISAEELIGSMLRDSLFSGDRRMTGDPLGGALDTTEDEEKRRAAGCP